MLDRNTSCEESVQSLTTPGPSRPRSLRLLASPLQGHRADATVRDVGSCVDPGGEWVCNGQGGWMCTGPQIVFVVCRSRV